MKKHFGNMLIAIALLHQVVGVVFYGAILTEIVRAGIINSVVAPYWDRDAAFWFFMFGGLLFVIGWFARWSYQHVGQYPSFMGWSLLIISAIGVVMMPASGLWLVIVVALLMIRDTRTTPQLSMK
jgi:hypothetical protein